MKLIIKKINNCKRCLKILGLNEEFIKKDEFKI